jgi:hypothetical protein
MEMENDLNTIEICRTIITFIAILLCQYGILSHLYLISWIFSVCKRKGFFCLASTNKFFLNKILFLEVVYFWDANLFISRKLIPCSASCFYLIGPSELIDNKISAFDLNLLLD